MSLINKIFRKLGQFISQYRSYAYTRVQDNNGLVKVVIREKLIKLYPQGQIAELLYTSDFERDEIEIVSKFIKPNHNIIDIGANIGLYSVLFRKLSSGTILAFEPSSESYDRLVNNLELNDIIDIVVHKAALSDTPNQYLELIRKPGYRDGDRHLNVAQSGNGSGGDVEKVFCTTLDSYLKQGERVDFIKIDIEGGELGAFKGAKEIFKSNPDLAIMFECTAHNCKQFGYDRLDVFTLLESFGFGIYTWDKERKSWVDGRANINFSQNFWAIKDSSKLPQS